MQQLIIAVILAAAICIALSPLLIPALKKLKFGQTEREDGPKSHLVKSGTPTMGGIMILAGILVATVVVVMVNRGSMEFALPALLVTFAYALVGFLDDFIKVKLKRSLGLKAYQKIIGQFGIDLVLALYAYNNPYIGSKIHLAFFQNNICLYQTSYKEQALLCPHSRIPQSQRRQLLLQLERSEIPPRMNSIPLYEHEQNQ